MRILMVCLGNICRSPLAEGILRHKVAERNLDWEVDSAGTGDWHIGYPPDSRSVDTAHRHGIDISDQRGRLFQPIDFERFDQILVMDNQNFRDVLRYAKTDEHRSKLQRILDFSFPGENRSVPDPYHDSLEGFESVYVMLDQACDSFLNRTTG